MKTRNSRQPVYAPWVVSLRPMGSLGFDSSTLTRHSSLLLALFICHLSFVNPAFGAEAASHGSEWKEWLWKILNFAILVFILIKFIGKPLREFLRQRTELIEKTLNEAKEAKGLAEKALYEVEKRLSLKDREIQEIINHSERSAKAEQDLLINQGEQIKAKIIEHAKANIDHELRITKDAIKAEAVEIAMEIAEQKLKKRLSEEKQLELVNESLSGIEAGK